MSNAVIANRCKNILCDFAKLRMNDCVDMTVNAINTAIAKPETKFFKVIASE